MTLCNSLYKLHSIMSVPTLFDHYLIGLAYTSELYAVSGSAPYYKVVRRRILARIIQITHIAGFKVRFNGNRRGVYGGHIVQCNVDCPLVLDAANASELTMMIR